MADDRLEIEIVLDDGSIQKGFAKIRDEAKKTERSVGDVFKKGLTTDISKPFDIAKSSIFNLRNAFVTLTAAVGGAAFLKNVTQAASQQQDAINALNVSLASAGTFSEEASRSFQELASQLQSQSRFGDEVILQQAALARNYARTNEEAEKLVTVAIDLAEATGVSLDSAVRNLGKTFGGLTGELGESVPALRNLTAEQLKAGAALDLIAQRFGGSALGATRTFSGALAQLSNVWGDFNEVGIGKAIAESPVVINFFNALSKTLQTLTESFKTGGVNLDNFLKSAVINTASAVRALIETFDVLAQVPTFIEFVWVSIQKSFASGINFVSKGVQKLFALFDQETATQLQKGIEDTNKELLQFDERLTEIAGRGNSISSSFDFARTAVDDFATTFQELSIQAAPSGPVNSPVAPVVAAVDKDLVALREKVRALQVETQAAIQASFFNSETVLAGTPTVFEDVSTKGTEALTKLQASLQQTRDQALQLSAQIGQAINNGIANTITNAVAATVDALREGRNAFGAFAKAALATIGDLAVQLGQTLIASGIGIEALKVLGGAAAIAAGIALVAIGTLIKGAAGGGAPSATGGSAVSPPLADLQPGGISGDLVEPGARVNVTINGAVFDSDETGLRIADILKEQGFQNAVIA